MQTASPQRYSDETKLSSQVSMIPVKVGVVIINWNSFDLLGRCLAALAAQDESINQTIVIDNGSDNPPEELPCPRPRETQYIRLDRNVGFAKANNIAVACLVDCEWIALVNPDAFPEPSWLSHLVDATRRFPGFSSFCGCMLSACDSSVVDGAGDVYHISGIVWRDGHGVAREVYPLHNREVFSPCAAAALYRRDVFESVGGFDEDFFCYLEDVDLGFRMRLAGYRSMLVAEAVVHHVGSATTGGSGSDFSVYHGHRNLVWAFIKNMPGPLFYALLPVHIVMNIVTIGIFTKRGQGRVAMCAKWDAIKGIPNMWRKRREIQSRRRASIADIWRLLDKKIYQK